MKKKKISKFDICGKKDRTCFNCPYQDTAYCPYEADTPHGWILWTSIKLAAIPSAIIVGILVLIKAI